jgi:hypothetical protein
MCTMCAACAFSTRGTETAFAAVRGHLLVEIAITHTDALNDSSRTCAAPFFAQRATETLLRVFTVFADANSRPQQRFREVAQLETDQHIPSTSTSLSPVQLVSSSGLRIL